MPYLQMQVMIEGNIPGQRRHAAGIYGHDLQQPFFCVLHQENALEAPECNHLSYNTFM